MSHGDAVAAAPAGFTALASSAGAPIAAFEDIDRGLAGVQWHPEVLHTQAGQLVLEHFLYDIAGCRRMDGGQHRRRRGRRHPGPGGRQAPDLRAVRRRRFRGRRRAGAAGGRQPADLCLRRPRSAAAGEAEQVERDFVAATGVDLKVVDAADQFLGALAGVTDPEEKRKIIGREFIRTFERRPARSWGRPGEVEFLVQGTLYPDVVESGGGEGAANIKSHHNVGGLPDDLQFRLVEPLRTLFKDEVRAVGEQLGLPAEIVWRHPFPGPGSPSASSVRSPGSAGGASPGRRHRPRRADRRRPGPRHLAVPGGAAGRRAFGRGPGRRRTYGHPVVLRPVTSEDAMTADWGRLPYEVLERISTRITNEVREVNRVVLDITSKPPGTIEWE